MFNQDSSDEFSRSIRTTPSNQYNKEAYITIESRFGDNTFVKGKILIGVYFFIKELYSESDWNKIKQHINFTGDFLYHHSYDENFFFRIFKAAEIILDEPIDQIGEKFGIFYVEYASKQTESEEIPLASVLGRTLVDYLRTENSLPEITCGKVSGPLIYFKRVHNLLEIKFVSVEVEICGPIYVGFVKAVAHTIFNIDPKIESSLHKSKKTKNQIYVIMVYSLDDQMSMKIFPKDTPNIYESNKSVLESIELPKKSALSLDAFAKHFPYMLVLDQQLNIIKHGSFFSKIIPQFDLEILKFDETFIMVQPNIRKFTFKEMLKVKEFAFLFVPRREYKSNIYLKGVFIENHIKDELCLVFVGGIRVLSISQMFKMGIYLSDYAPYDENKCCVFKYDRYVQAHQNNAINEENYLELYRLIGQINTEKNIRDSLLYNVIPPKIAELLKQGKQSEPSLYKNTFVMFVGIYNFKRLCEYLQPIELAKLVNDLYLLFDLVVKEQKNVIKIETASDKYLITNGLDASVPANVLSVLECAFEMIDVAKLIKINNISLLTCGIHVGDIVAGVIGTKLPRYCIFGSTVNIASRTETTCVPGVVNVTEMVYNILLITFSSNELFVKKRGTVQMKGIDEPFCTYLVSRSRAELNEEVDSSRLDALLHLCSVTKKHESSDLQSFLNVQTPIPRKITNIFGLKHQFTIDQIETYIKKRLQRIKHKPKLQ